MSASSSEIFHVDGNLKIWIQSAYHIALELNCEEVPGEDTLSLCDKAVYIGKCVFSLADGSNLNDLLQEMRKFYVMQYHGYENMFDPELLLIHAVSDHCDHKASFVKGIIDLESSVQMDLMEIIQCSASYTITTADTPQHSPEKEIVQIQPNQTMDKCLLCDELQQKNNKIVEELKNRLSCEEDKSNQLKEALAVETNKVVDAELIILEKENNLFQKDQELSKLKKQLDDSLNALNADSALKEKLSSLQDEIDVLKPKAMKLETLQSQADRMRSKLEEVSDLKQQLREESKAHSDLHNKFLVMEQELEAAKKLKPQLEQYRTQFTETKIELDELKLKLMEQEKALQELDEKNNELSGSQKVNMVQNQYLADELKTTAERLREKERMNGFGEGMTEFNPVVMQELNQLRSENKVLLEKLDKTSEESLEKLEKELTDAKSIGTSLQKKWMTTKDSLEKANIRIQLLEGELSQLRASYLDLSQQFQSSVLFAEEDKRALGLQKDRQIDFANRKRKAELQLQRAGLTSVFDRVSSKLQKTKDLLNCRKTEASELSEKLSEKTCLLQQTEEELRKTSEERESEKQSHLESFQLATEEYLAAVQKVKMENEEKEMATRAQHEIDLQEEKVKQMALQAELETETHKRRKLERMKKYQEAEAQRQKAQLQAAVAAMAGGGGAGGYGVEDLASAVKELKAMQDQLDAARAEVSFLKSQQWSGSSGDGKGIEGTTEVSSKGTNGTEVKPVAVNSALRAPLRTRQQAGNSGGHFHQSSDMYEGFEGYLEETQLQEKKIEQLTREKRELLSKSLEEGKEKMEIAQKLLIAEKEVNSMKAEMRKLVLDKERMERKVDKYLATNPVKKFVEQDKENVM